MSMEQEPGDDIPLDDMSPQQLEQYDYKRQAIAALMAPFMVRGVEIATERTEEANIVEPLARYSVLAAATRYTLNDLSLQADFVLDYEHYGSAFSGTEDYFRVFEERFPSLMRAAVEDAAWVGLGGYAFLESVGRSSEAAEIIPRSLGLLAVTGTHGHRDELRAGLGDPINAGNFAIHPHRGQDELGFTPEAYGIINRFPSRLKGCPARDIRIDYEDIEGSAAAMPDPRNNNLLTLYWGDVSKYAFEKVA